MPVNIEIYAPFQVRSKLRVKSPIKLTQHTSLIPYPKRVVREADLMFGQGKPLEFMGREHAPFIKHTIAYQKGFLDYLKQSHPFSQNVFLIGQLPDPSICNFLTACDLVKPIFFWIDIEIIRAPLNGEMKVRSVKRLACHSFRIQLLSRFELPYIEKGDVKKIRALLQHIEETNKSPGRLRQALISYSRALLTEDLEFAFLLYWQVLEALFSPGGTEVSHRICEIAAAVLHPFGSDRLEAYDQLRELYRIRSKIVHGESRAIKDLPMLTLKISEYARQVLSAVLQSFEYKKYLLAQKPHKEFLKVVLGQ